MAPAVPSLLCFIHVYIMHSSLCIILAIKLPHCCSMSQRKKWQGSQWCYRRKIQQDALAKVNRVKEIRRRGKGGLSRTDNSILWWKHEYKVWGEGKITWSVYLCYWITLHCENYISISFHIEWDVIVVTVFLSILNQMEFQLFQNWKKNCYHDHIYFDLKGNGNIVFSVFQAMAIIYVYALYIIVSIPL